MRINKLWSGGLITNYYCSSRCRHCLYACSPGWKKEYIDKPATLAILQKIKSLGVYSIHIGGGEPLLDVCKLLDVADAVQETGMHIDYVETNSSWYQNEAAAFKTLEELMRHGVFQLLVSISPFHNEHIPFYKVKGVLGACRKTGMKVFPWIMDLYNDLDAFNDDKTHTLEEYENKFGSKYLSHMPSRYWIHPGGRAIGTYKNILPLHPLEAICKSPPCTELTDTSHFHVDLFGNYIPGLCAGLAIKTHDLGHDLDPESYPLITMLYQSGIGVLLKWVMNEFQFEPEPAYMNKCHLCNEIRSFLVHKNHLGSTELFPFSYYEYN